MNIETELLNELCSWLELPSLSGVASSLPSIVSIMRVNFMRYYNDNEDNQEYLQLIFFLFIYLHILTNNPYHITVKHPE